MKVLILTAKFGMGHLSASKAIKEDMLKFNKEADIKVVDFYEYSMPFLAKYIYKGFSLLIKYGKEAYKNSFKSNFKGKCSKGWMWRMSDFLSVCLQDFLYSC